MERTRNKKTSLDIPFLNCSPAANMVSYEISEEPIVISKYLIETLLAINSDCLTLYIFYYYTAKWQKTNQPKCTTMYVAKGLNWGEHRVRKTKKLLIKLNLVKDVQARNTTGITGHYIKLRFIWSQEKIQPTTLEKPTLTESTRVAKKPTLTETYRVGISKGNTLSKNSLNALSKNNKKIIIKKDLPFSYFQTYLPKTYLENKTFLESLNDFIQHRINIKVPLTDMATKKLSNKFKKFKVEEVITALDDSVESGKWSGVYPKSKNAFKSSGKNNHKEENKTYRKSDVEI